MPHNQNKNHLPPVVNGCSSAEAIANSSKCSFEKNSTPNDSEQVGKLNREFSARYNTYLTSHESACDCKLVYISSTNVIDALIATKEGKCANEDDISAEHLHSAPLNVLQRLASLFNAMLKHSFVPHQFRRGFMMPIVKDQAGHHADIGNYREITISPVISKLFEHVLKLVFF